MLWRRSWGRWTEPKHDSKAQQDSNSTPIPGFLQVQDLFALELFSDDFLLNCCLPQINIVGVIPLNSNLCKNFSFQLIISRLVQLLMEEILSVNSWTAFIPVLSPRPHNSGVRCRYLKEILPKQQQQQQVSVGNWQAFSLSVRHNPLLPETCAISLKHPQSSHPSLE